MTYNSICVYTKTYLACFWLSIFSQELFVPHVATSSPPRLPYKSSCHACHGCQTLNIMHSWDWHNPPEQVHSKKAEGIVLQPLFFRGDLLSFSEPYIYKSASAMSHMATKTMPKCYLLNMNEHGEIPWLSLVASRYSFTKKNLTHVQEGHPFAFIDKFNLSFFVNPSWDYQPLILILLSLKTSTKHVEFMIAKSKNVEIPTSNSKLQKLNTSSHRIL